jgi:hypothetical protein
VTATSKLSHSGSSSFPEPTPGERANVEQALCNVCLFYFQVIGTQRNRDAKDHPHLPLLAIEPGRWFLLTSRDHIQVALDALFKVVLGLHPSTYQATEEWASAAIGLAGALLKSYTLLNSEEERKSRLLFENGFRCEVSVCRQLLIERHANRCHYHCPLPPP